LSENTASERDLPLLEHARRPLVQSGVLALARRVGPDEARIIAALIASVEQLEPLVEEATLVIHGDAEAAVRWRALLAWEPDGSASVPPAFEPAPPGIAAVNESALMALWIATVLAATNVPQLAAMTARLSELLSPVEVIERARAAVMAGAGAPVMRTYAAIGVPGLPVGGIPGLGGGSRALSGPPGGGIPGGGTPVPDDPEGPPELPPLGDGLWPGGRRKPVGGDPGDIDSMVEWLAKLFPRPGKSAQIPCGLQALVETKALQKSVPAYRIDSISPSDACAGEVVSLRGQDFGPPGTVVFAGGEPGSEVAAISWTGTHIEAVVPAAARPGPVRVKSKIDTIRVCDRMIDVFRDGNTIGFDGGAPTVIALTVDGRDTDCWAVPGPATVEWWIPVSTAMVTITVTAVGGASSATVHAWPAERSATVTIPDARWVTVEASYSTRCGKATATRLCWVGSPGTLQVLGLEVTQGIQRFKLSSEGWTTTDRSQWNSLPLIAGKPTVVRAFVAVAYDLATTWRGFEITGWLELLHPVTRARIGPTLSPLRRDAAGALVNGVHITITQHSLVDRDSSGASLNFLIPPGLATDDLELLFTAVVVDGYGTGATVTRRSQHHWRSKSSLNVHYVRVTGKEGGTRPPLGDLETRQAVAEGLSVLPFPVLRLAPAPEPIINSDEIWTAHDGNDRLLDQLVDLSETEDDTRYMGIVNWPPVSNAVSGTSTQCETTSWATREKIVIAHEIGHQLCLRHVAPWGPELDDEGLDTLPNDGRIFNTPFDPTAMATVRDLAATTELWDFMIARPAIGGAPVRPLYISEANWQRLADNYSAW
jgi:hypothetical protein